MGETRPGRAGRSGRVMGRRDFLRLGGAGLAGAALLGSGTLAGCGGGGGSSGGFDGEVTVGFGREASGALRALIDEFNDQNQDITVKRRRMPSDTGQYFDQLRTEFQAQSGDTTLIGGDVIWPAQFAAAGYIVDLSDRFPEGERREFLPGPIRSNIYEDKIWGVPWFTDAGLLYYRRDLLEKSGFSAPPKTWDELKDMARKVTRDQGTKYGFVFQGAEYEGGVVNGPEYVYGHGGNVISDEDASNVVIDSPEAAAGLATERSMVEDGVAPQAVSTYTEPESEAAFLGGDAVFCRNWPYMYSLAGSNDYPDVKAGMLGIAPLPAAEGGESVSGLGGWNFFINAFAPQEAQDAAYEFVRFMTAPEQQKFFALEGSYLPTLQALYDDPEIKDQVPTVRPAPEALARTEPRPVSPYYSDMSLALAEGFQASLKGDVTPEQAVGTLQGEVEEIVEQGS